MKTLSDDITVKLPTTGLTEGYMITTIYANSIGVFTGQSYIAGNNSSLYINLNDIAAQNRGKYDYIKLNDDKQLESVPGSLYIRDGQTYWSRFLSGQIGNYSVKIVRNTSSYEQSEDVLTGYDYPNKDIRPSMIENNNDSYLGRIMQGCIWTYDHDEEIGIFNNLMLPHLPKVATKKFGFGLQLWHPSGTGGQYAIRTQIGQDVSLGHTVFRQSAMTFMTLYDFMNSSVGISQDEDTSIYLKLYGTSGDEFGDYEEGLTLYRGHVFASEIKVLGEKNGVTTELGTYDYGATYLVYVNKYIRANPHCDWDYNAIEQGNLEVYVTHWDSIIRVTNDVQEYEESCGRVEIRKSSMAEFEYDHLYAEPIFTHTLDTVSEPDIFYGTCPIAILDNCYSRYYLAWNDRYGDIMSQPFDGKIEYGEDIENDEIKDYKERRRVSHKTVQPKWTLNTKWLSEDVYPMYEAIFTSPYVLLYDTQTDRAWNVIVTNSSYKEKTHKTEKTLFNLELKVEANKTENYIF